jgi:hypothetical protein
MQAMAFIPPAFLEGDGPPIAAAVMSELDSESESCNSQSVSLWLLIARLHRQLQRILCKLTIRIVGMSNTIQAVQAHISAFGADQKGKPMSLLGKGGFCKTCPNMMLHSMRQQTSCLFLFVAFSARRCRGFQI